MLDSCFISDIRKVANGDKTKKYATQLAKDLKMVAKELERRYEFNDCIKRHGREKVALCIASTMYGNYEYEADQRAWAGEIMKLWQNKLERSVSSSKINIHPAILADNSYSFRILTTHNKD